MSRFSGPQAGFKMDRGPSRNRGPKGVLRALREERREEAEKRNASSDPESRADWRRRKAKEHPDG